MSKMQQLVKEGRYEEALSLDPAQDEGSDKFLRVSCYLSLGKGKEAMAELLARRDELFALDPLLTLKVNFEVRLLLKQFDEAEKDLEYFENLPYVSQKVEEALRGLKGTIASTRYASAHPSQSLDEILEILSSPSDDLMLLSALNGLKKVGELEDYRDLVEELLLGPYHDDVKTYALMLLSAKGSDHEVAFVKRGRTFRVNPAKLGSPYAMKEYRYLRDKLNVLSDQSLREVCGELLDLYALICYPERFVNVGEEDLFLTALLALGRRYLGQKEGELDPDSAKLLETLAKTIAENPPLLG